MPNYEYKCERCGNVFETRRSIAEREEKATCPVCGETECHQVYSGFSKGSSCSTTGYRAPFRFG